MTYAARILRDVRWLVAGFLLHGLLAGSSPQQPTSIPFTAVEKLQVEVLLLKAAAAGSKSQPLQLQYQAAVSEQKGYYAQLKVLGDEILRTRGLAPSEWAVSWDTFEIVKAPAPTPKPVP